MSRVSLIPSLYPSFSTGESGNGDTGLAHQNKIAGCGRGVRGCHCLWSSIHVEAELVHQVEVGETRQGASQLEGGREGWRKKEVVRSKESKTG